MASDVLSTPSLAPLPAAVPTEPIMRLTVEQYHEMYRNGILTEDDRVELLEGWLVPKMTKSPRHSTVIWLLRAALERLVPAGWYVDSQDVTTLEDSEPEPDIVVVRGDRRQYRDRHPSPQDLTLLVEVADTSLHRDRGSKKRLYARAGVREYWIVNLPEGRLEVYTAPSGPAEEPDYGRRQDYTLSDTVPLVLDGREVGRLAVRDWLS